MQIQLPANKYRVSYDLENDSLVFKSFESDPFDFVLKLQSKVI